MTLVSSCTTAIHVCAFAQKFTGKERDTESGLDYFGARYFSSVLGRFSSPDWSSTPEPVPYADMDNPQSLNLYSYVLNNPLSHRDPDGHSCDPDTSSTDPKTGALTVAAGACHLDWWDLPGHAFVGLANIMTGHTKEGAKQMFDAYSLPLSIAVPLVGIGGELTTLSLEGGAEALLSDGTKQAAKGVVDSLPEGAQKDAAKRAVGRATNSEKVSITKNADGSITVSKARPGVVNGQQIMETKITSSGQTNTVQRAFDPQAGYHIDPKGGSK
jgi:RHS repeat-associated protein